MKKILALILTVTLLFCSAQTVLATSARLSISARSAVLIDADSHQILFEKNSRERMGMASTTKIMTALVAAECFDLKKEVTISEEAVGIEGSSVYLYKGEVLTMEELLYALLLQSANDAAAAIAIAVSGSIDAFAVLMNEKAAELGLSDTHFTNPHGLYDEEHYTTAYDLSLITAHLLNNDILRQIVSTYKKELPIDSNCNSRLLVNHNKMLKLYDGAIGVKTGFTKSTGRCLVSAAEREGLTLISVTLSAPDDWNDHKRILDHGFSLYESVLIAKAGEFTYNLPLTGGEKDYLPLTNSHDIRLTLPKIRGELSCSVEAVHRFEFAPIMRGIELGRVIYSYDGVSADSPLISAQSISRKK